MSIKKVAKCTGKVLAKTALFSGGLFIDVITQLPEAVAAKDKGEKYTPEREKNGLSKWLYNKASKIEVFEKKED